MPLKNFPTIARQDGYSRVYQPKYDSFPAVFSSWRKRLIASGLTFSCDRAVSVLSAILAPVDHYDARRRSCSSAGGMIGRELLAGTGHQVSATATYRDTKMIEQTSPYTVGLIEALLLLASGTPSVKPLDRQPWPA